MALNLKRKRPGEQRPRKAAKLDQPSDVESGDGLLEEGSEDEEWEGIRDHVEPETMKTTVPMDPSSSKRTKAPTGEEVRAIREATDLYQSSSFKLQIDALLPNMRPKLSRVPPLETFLLQLHTFLMSIPPIEPQHPLDAARKLIKKGVAVPYCLPLPTEDTNWKVSFEKPDDITLVGSWPNKVTVKPKDGHRYGVDIAVQIPDSLFQEKDYLNARFFQKKAFYLATLANSIRSPKSGLNVDVFYESSSGDPRLTKLVLVPKPNDSQTDFTKLNARVCIIPTISSTAPISLHRLSPSHANIRVNSSKTSEESTYPPSPIYNNAILIAFSPKPHLLSTYNLIHSIPAFVDALALLRLWGNQRGFGEGTKISVNGFENAGTFWPALLDLIINGEEPSATGVPKRKPLGKGLSSYQLFKAALNFLATHNFIAQPALVKSTASSKFSPNEFKENCAATFVDSSSLVNLVSYIPPGCLDLLRHEVAKTLQVLHSSSMAIDPFTEVFLHDHRDVSTRFDIVFQVDLSSANARTPCLDSLLDFGSPTNHLLFRMNTILRKALGDRIRAVAFLQPSSTPTAPSARPLTQAHPSTSSTVFVGLVLDPTQAFRLVEHGPAVDSEDTDALAEFRDLWGSKSEMRRFKDGRITESVVWDVKTADERNHVPAMVVQHILLWHFGISESHVKTWQSEYDSIIRLPTEVAGRYVQVASSGIGFKGALQAFDALVKAMKALDQLPLSLTNVSAASPSLRYTSAFSPVPLTSSLAASLPPNARYLQPLDIILEFEQSAKWPDELRAIQKIKLAFFAALASGLIQSMPGLKASVVLGAGDITDANELMDKAYLEIITLEGWAFHARVWHNREATLLDRILDDHGLLPHVVLSKKRKREERKGKEYLDAAEAKEVYDRRFLHAPRHHRAVAALSHQHQAFSGTCRLVKRWFGSHWFLGGHVSEEVVELLCAQVFVGDGKFVGSDEEVPVRELSVVPSTKERGFAMVIRFLSEWKWEEGGLWVCLYGPKKKEGESEGGQGASKVDALKVSGPGGLWVVSTDMDRGGKTWTKKGPDAIVARRIRALAGATWNYLQTIEDGSFYVRGMFIHPTEDYDFVVQLKPSALSRYVHNVATGEAFTKKGAQFVNSNAKGSDQDLVLPGFDPALSLFNDLQRTYSDTFRLFFDPYGGDSFGAVWDPTLKEPRPFRVLGGFSSVPTKKESEKAKEKGLVALNEASVLAEIQRLGSGLVKDVVSKQ